MIDDIKKLVKFEQQVRELNKLKGQLEDEESYDSVSLSLSSTIIIKVEWRNESGNFAKSYQFPFSAIADVGERMRKKCDYRKIKIESKKK